MHTHTYILRTYISNRHTYRQTDKIDRQTPRQADETRHKMVERGHKTVTQMIQWILDYG